MPDFTWDMVLRDARNKLDSTEKLVSQLRISLALIERKIAAKEPFPAWPKATYPGFRRGRRRVSV